MKKTSLLIVGVIAAVLVAIVAYYSMKSTDTVQQVSTFEECVAAGNPVMESYPRQCVHEGETFTEVITDLNEGTTGDDAATDVPTSADNAEPGSIHNLPVPEAVAAVRTRVANELGVSEGEVTILTAYEKEWPNACLGLAGEDEMCAEVITPGYEVTVKVAGKEYTYRTNSDGSSIRKKTE